jgi:hypothetical protein
VIDFDKDWGPGLLEDKEDRKYQGRENYHTNLQDNYLRADSRAAPVSRSQAQ